MPFKDPEEARRYYQRNKAVTKARSARRYLEHREQVLRMVKANYLVHRREKLEYASRYRQTIRGQVVCLHASLRRSIRKRAVQQEKIYDPKA